MSLALRFVRGSATARPIVPAASPAKPADALSGAAQLAKPAAVGETQLERLVKPVSADVVALYVPAVGLGIGATIRTALRSPTGADYSSGDIHDYSLSGVVGTSF